jgi:hypothetical protein
VVWSKPNGLPESVTDRVRRSHEQWFHLVQQPRYYSAVDELRLENVRRPRPGEISATIRSKYSDRLQGGKHHHRLGSGDWNPLGRLPGSVWEIATQPLHVPEHLGVDHFAAFPVEWPRRLILGWSPPGICLECGEGRRPVCEVAHADVRHDRSRSWSVGSAHARDAQHTSRVAAIGAVTTITGYACACTPYDDAEGAHDLRGWTPPATRPAVVLDPFGGTGTTALAARALGRLGITVDRSADYCRLAQWRVGDSRQIAKAMQVESPPKEADGQDALFNLDGLAETGESKTTSRHTVPPTQRGVQHGDQVGANGH